MNIFVGNLSKSVTEDDLVALFSECGHVQSAKIIRDMFTQESKGYGFIEMPGLKEARAAIEKLNTKEFMGKRLTVSEARSRLSGNRRFGDSRNGGRGDRHRFGNK